MAPIIYLRRYSVLNDTSGSAVVLQRNASGATYKAEDISTGAAVALRLADFDPSNRAEVEREAAAAKELNHINLPKVLDCGVEGTRLVCASELLDGTSAQEWVTAHGPMPTGAALRIALQAVNALGAATFHGLLRNAINPADILIIPGQTADGEWPLIKMLNFTDLALADGTDEPRRKFSSPEQQLGAAVDFRSQIYSLGATLVFLLTGEAPAGAASLRRTSGLPKPVAQLVTRMLATDPAQRPTDPLSFQEEIRTCLDQVERREAIGRRFGIPVAVTRDQAPLVTTNDRSPRMLLKPLAFAAGLMVVGGIAAAILAKGYIGGKPVARDEKPIGVTVGVPDKTAAASSRQVTQAPDATPSSDLVTAAPATGTRSTAEKQDLIPTNTPATAVAASNDIRSDSQPDAPQVAANEPPQLTSVPEPTPPAEGAAETDTRVADAPPRSTPDVQEPAATAAPTASSRIAAAAVEPEPVKRSAPPKPAPIKAERPRVADALAQTAPTKVSSREVRRAQPADDTGLPPLAAGRKRARYVGTAPDGSLIFEMPSAERVYSAPAGARRRRVRPADDEMPVMRAEPIADGELPEGR